MYIYSHLLSLVLAYLAPKQELPLHVHENGYKVEEADILIKRNERKALEDQPVVHIFLFYLCCLVPEARRCIITHT